MGNKKELAESDSVSAGLLSTPSRMRGSSHRDDLACIVAEKRNYRDYKQSLHHPEIPQELGMRLLFYHCHAKGQRPLRLAQ